MTQTAKNGIKSTILAFSTVHNDLVYRSLVFARLSQQQRPLYFVAGVEGGPWSAQNALSAAHKLHGGPCYYCQKSVAKGQATIDHVEPVCRGGKDDIQNLVIACKPCNAGKGHQAIEFYSPNAGKKWLEAVQAQINLRLSALTPASSQQPPSPPAKADP